jgi:hypothetical protein
MPDDKTIDFVVAFLAIGLLTLGVGSWLLGWLVRTWDRFVNRSQVVMSHESGQTESGDRTDDRQTMVSEAEILLNRTELDRTRLAWVTLMVYKGYSVGEIRGLLKGDNGVIGTEIEAARQRLGIVGEPRHLRVRDDQGERLIPMDA